VRVAVRRSTLLIVGAKLSPLPDAGARFHVAERAYGRFARAVRLAGAFDAARARALDLRWSAARRTAAPRRPPRPRAPDYRGARMTRLLFIGDVVGKPGRELTAARPGARSSRTTGSIS
jgi:hypothetical protein